jgi:hypothetical protein
MEKNYGLRGEKPKKLLRALCSKSHFLEERCARFLEMDIFKNVQK